MKMDLSFVKRKVGRRIFAQFILCALGPIIALAIISLFQVRAELEKQGQARLHEATRSLGEIVYERLLNLENDLSVFSQRIQLDSGNPDREIKEKYLEHVREPLEALALFTGKQIIHPNQIVPVQEAYSPSDAEIDYALRLLASFEAAEAEGTGAIDFEGKMIDMPLVLSARQVIERAKAAGKIT